MNKEFIFEIPKNSEIEKNINYIFRNKFEIIYLIMKTISFIKNNNQITKISDNSILLKIDKCSRLFYFINKKFYSINFPFKVDIQDEFSIYYESFKIESNIISSIISIFTDLKKEKEIQENKETLFHVCELIENAFNEFNLKNYFRFEEYENIILKLIIFEDGYIRYDHDYVREKGDTHPLNHLDVFYSTENTFKMGLNKTINQDEFIDILDIKTNCYFLSEKIKSPIKGKNQPKT